jgi:hypothetical protein
MRKKKIFFFIEKINMKILNKKIPEIIYFILYYIQFAMKFFFILSILRNKYIF